MPNTEQPPPTPEEVEATIAALDDDPASDGVLIGVAIHVREGLEGLSRHSMGWVEDSIGPILVRLLHERQQAREEIGLLTAQAVQLDLDRAAMKAAADYAVEVNKGSDGRVKDLEEENARLNKLTDEYPEVIKGYKELNVSYKELTDKLNIENAQLHTDKERLMSELAAINARLVETVTKVESINENPEEVNTENTAERREAGEQIYMDGTAMQEGDLVEVWPSGAKFDRPKKWIRAQGWITALNRIRVTVGSSDDSTEENFHPADLTLVSRVEK